MLLYFSATGNCKYVAARLASAFGQETVSIVDCIQDGVYSFADDAIGIVVPTYFWGLPSIVKEFLEKADFHTDYLYFISTYGTTPGASDAMASKAIQGKPIDAFYSVRVPDTWTPIFDLSTPEKVAAFSGTTEAEIDEVIRKIGERHTNRHMTPRTPAFLAEWIAQPIYNNNKRRTAHFCVASKVKFGFRSLKITVSIFRDFLAICACRQEIIIDKNATTAPMTEIISALILIVIFINTPSKKDRMGIHPHGCLGGAKAYRRIIIVDNVGKFKFPAYLRRKYRSYTR